MVEPKDNQGYAEDALGLNWELRGGGFVPITLNEITNPGSTIYLVDSKPGADFWHVGQNTENAANPTTDFPSLDARHAGRFCALYVDGHSDYVTEDNPSEWCVQKPM